MFVAWLNQTKYTTNALQYNYLFVKFVLNYDNVIHVYITVNEGWKTVILSNFLISLN